MVVYSITLFYSITQPWGFHFILCFYLSISVPALYRFQYNSSILYLEVWNGNPSNAIILFAHHFSKCL